jgi:hypothetical protein
MKMMISIVLIFSSMVLSAQNRIDLSKIAFNEKPEVFLKGATTVREGKMFDRNDMVSYGIDNKYLFYKEYLPDHIELLAYKGQVAGCAFKVYHQSDQDKIVSYLKQKYKSLKGLKTNTQQYYSCKEKGLFIEFTAINQEQFKKGMNAYLSIKTLDFHEAYEKLLKH